MASMPRQCDVYCRDIRLSVDKEHNKIGLMKGVSISELRVLPGIFWATWLGLATVYQQGSCRAAGQLSSMSQTHRKQLKFELSNQQQGSTFYC